MVVGVDGRGSGVTFVLQASIETLVHLSVVPIKATAYTMIFFTRDYFLFTQKVGSYRNNFTVSLAHRHSDYD